MKIKIEVEYKGEKLIKEFTNNENVLAYFLSEFTDVIFRKIILFTEEVDLMLKEKGGECPKCDGTGKFTKFKKNEIIGYDDCKDCNGTGTKI